MAWGGVTGLWFGVGWSEVTGLWSGVTGLRSGVEWVGKEIDAPAAAMVVPAAAAADQEEPGSSGTRHGGWGSVGGEDGHGAWRHPDVGARDTEEVGP